MPVNNLKNDSLIPMGAQVVRRLLIADTEGQVHHVRTYYAGGEFRQITQKIDTTNRGVLLPDYKLPEFIRAKFRGAGGQPGTRPPFAVETPQQQTAANAPVGTQGATNLPVVSGPVALFGRPGVVSPARRAQFQKE